MSHANRHSKPHLDMIERQRAMMQGVKASLGRLAPMVVAFAEEGHRLAIRLNNLAAEFDRASLRGEIPDPDYVAQLSADKADYLQRAEQLNAHMQALGQQADGVTSAMEAVSFDILVRQFMTQFNIKEDL